MSVFSVKMNQPGKIVPKHLKYNPNTLTRLWWLMVMMMMTMMMMMKFLENGVFLHIR